MSRSWGFGLVAAMLVTAAAAGAPAAAMAAGSTVSGSVTVPTGANAAHVHALLLDSTGSEVAAATVLDTGNSTTSGTYTFTDVADGTYVVYLIDPVASDDVAPAYYGGAAALSGATAIDLTGPDTVPAVSLGSGGEIDGAVTDGNSGDAAVSVEACQVGAPDPGQVAYWAAAATGSYTGGTVCETAAVSSGEYSLGGLVPGASYTLLYTFTNSAQGWTDRYLVDGGSLTADQAAATDFTDQTGAALVTSFTVPALGSVSGVATDPGGLPDSELTVELVDAAGTELTPAVTFSSGTYTVGGLLPGGYRVEFLPDSPLLGRQFYPAAATLAAAEPVTVTGGSVTASINVTLALAASISGTVSAAQGGADLGGLEVEVLDASGNVLSSASTTTDGAYSITGLPAGTWYLRFDGGRAGNGTYYATEYYGGSATLAGSAAVTLTAGETLVDADQALIEQSTTPPGAPSISHGALSGLFKDKVALRFTLTSGSGTAGYLKTFRIKLPKNISWNRRALARDLSVPEGAFTYVINDGLLVVSVSPGQPVLKLTIKAGGITVSKGIEKLAKARKLATEKIAVSATDTTGLTTSLGFIVERPH